MSNRRLSILLLSGHYALYAALPLANEDVGQERSLYPADIAKEKAGALIRYAQGKEQLQRLGMGISSIEAKLRSLDVLDRPEQPELDAQMLGDQILNEAILTPLRSGVLYRPDKKQRVYIDLAARVYPTQHVPQTELEKGILMLKPLRKIQVPACLTPAEVETYVQIRYVRQFHSGSYWSHLHDPKVDETTLKLLRYFEYLDLYAPPRDIVIFTALEYQLQHRGH